LFDCVTVAYVTEREKDASRGDRTHNFCYPGRYSQAVRLEETSNSPVYNVSEANKNYFQKHPSLSQTK